MTFMEKTGSVPHSDEVLLAIDSSLGSVAAVSVGDGAAWQVAHADPLGHAENIGNLIIQALQLADVRAAQVTGVVMGVGPGPFTGLRVGMAAAHGFASGNAVPLLPVVSHEGNAYELAVGEVRVVQDARRKELFISDWVRTTDSAPPLLVTQPRVVPREGYEPTDHDVTPEAVSGIGLLAAALHKLQSGEPFAAPERSLRDPDVRPPAKRVAL